MNHETQRSLLRNFFSAYFHEDWLCEADSTAAVVTEYTRVASPDDMRSLAKSILDYARGFASEEELEQNLFMDLGCYYRPNLEGLSTRIWLEGIADQLLSAASD